MGRIKKGKRSQYDTVVHVKCYGCNADCVVGLGEDDIPGIVHPMPPCKAFMLDQPLEDFLRKCREGS